VVLWYAVVVARAVVSNYPSYVVTPSTVLRSNKSNISFAISIFIHLYNI
jgi:hypothetical protein